MKQISLQNKGPQEGLRGLYSYTIPVSGIGDIPGVIAIANLINGAALGGWRVMPYPSLEAATRDAARLACDMRLKFGCPNIPVGGAKSCIVIDPQTLNPEQNRELCYGFGEVLKRLHEKEGIRYVSGKDIGRHDEDIDMVAEVAPGLVGAGSPSGPTAEGVFVAIQAIAETENIKTVAIEGLGAVGMALAGLLLEGGYRVFGYDKDNERNQLAEKLGVGIVSSVMTQAADVFSPCAGPFGLNPRTIPLLQADYVIGSANIELEDPERDSVLLQKEGIVHLPGFVVNVGGAGSLVNPFLPASHRVRFDDLLSYIRDMSQRLNRHALVIDGRTTYHLAKNIAEVNIERMEKEFAVAA